MNAHSSMLHVRVDDDLKAKATEALNAIGLSTSDAVRLLLHRIVADQAFPLELKVPNATTRAALDEVQHLLLPYQGLQSVSGANLCRDTYCMGCLKLSNH